MSKEIINEAENTIRSRNSLATNGGLLSSGGDKIKTNF